MQYTYKDVEIHLATKYQANTIDKFYEKKNKFFLLKNLDRSKFNGSFMIFVYFKKATSNGALKEVRIGQKSVFKRWDMTNCKNCQKRYLVNFQFRVPYEVTDINTQIKVNFLHMKSDFQLTTTEFNDWCATELDLEAEKPILELRD